MAVHLEALGLDQLSVEERLELIEAIWNSLPENLELKELPDWHLAEIAKRRAQASAEASVGKPWRDVLAQLEAKP